MDMLTMVGAGMLVLWAAGAFFLEAPGFIHLFLSLGVFLVILGAVKRGEARRKKP